VFRITLVQVVILGLVWAIVYGSAHALVAECLVLGGLIAIVPQAFFAWRVFQYQGARAAASMAKASYAGEIGKFLLAVSGFALVFAFYRPLQAWAVFAGYGGMVIIQVMGSWLLLRHSRPVNRT
jgi:ATP synthase protein I